MKFIQNPDLLTTTVDLELYEGESKISVILPVNFKYIVVDWNHVLIGYEHEPINSCGFYHPQPGTDFIILGQMFDKDNKPLPPSKEQNLINL